MSTFLVYIQSGRYAVQSHICDKKLELERQKLVEQAKRIARPSKGKRPLDEIRLFNSMVLGIQNYFQLATCISIDCRKIHRQVMTVLTNRLNTETGCKLVREGGAMTESEKERFGKSAMVRYVSGIDQPIYPIAYIKNKILMAKKTAVCSYTADGRALIHTNLSLNSFVLAGLRNQPSMGRTRRTHRQQDFIILCSTWKMCAKWRLLWKCGWHRMLAENSGRVWRQGTLSKHDFVPQEIPSTFAKTPDEWAESDSWCAQNNKGTDVKSKQSAWAGWFVRNRIIVFHLEID